MVRRAGHFRARRIAELPPQEQDFGEALESKWRNWVQQESFKRQVHYQIPTSSTLTVHADWLYTSSTATRDHQCRSLVNR